MGASDQGNTDPTGGLDYDASPSPLSQKFFMLAQASFCVPLTEKCFVESSCFTAGSNQEGVQKPASNVAPSSRSRVLVTTVTPQTGASMSRPTNQRNGML